MGTGIHTATDVSNVLTCLKNAGKTFVGRYFAVNNTRKALTKTEAQNISNAGVYIVSIWEDGPADTPSYFTFSQGRVDGKNAFSLAANAFNQTASTPVYFCVDFDADTSNKQAILDYFSGVLQGYGDYVDEQRRLGKPQIAYFIGVYGSYWVLDWCKTQAIAQYFFQAYAPGWSGGQNANAWPGYHLRQRGSNQSLCNISVDPDDSSGSAGGWKY